MEEIKHYIVGIKKNKPEEKIKYFNKFLVIEAAGKIEAIQKYYRRPEIKDWLKREEKWMVETFGTVENKDIDPVKWAKDNLTTHGEIYHLRIKTGKYLFTSLSIYLDEKSQILHLLDRELEPGKKNTTPLVLDDKILNEIIKQSMPAPPENIEDIYIYSSQKGVRIYNKDNLTKIDENRSNIFTPFLLKMKKWKN
ncbi:MAG: hypothetical protein ACOC1K_00995 [Nanoarchaeota archaeon]